MPEDVFPENPRPMLNIEEKSSWERGKYPVPCPMSQKTSDDANTDRLKNSPPRAISAGLARQIGFVILDRRADLLKALIVRCSRASIEQIAKFFQSIGICFIRGDFFDHLEVVAPD